jgi:prepilin-type N-terminal cleavage/methylation domain-containing protein
MELIQSGKQKKAVRGFSLLELLVVITIFSVISLVILANHSRFNSSVLLGSLAYKIALSVREAQVYGLSVQGQLSNVQGQLSNFQVGYGVHFAGGTTYILFADLNANKKYDGTPTDSIVKSYTVSQGHTISEFCGIRSTGQHDCAVGNSITYLDVVFFRPNPDAIMTSSAFQYPSSYSSAEITVSSPAGSSRKVSIASTGQISVVVATP